MNERHGATTFKGDPLTLVGPERSVGDDAPDATLVANDLSEVRLGDYKGKVVVLSCVPSLDTGVCSLQSKRFNDEAASMPDIEVVTVSMDLPFAQKRWADENDAGNLTLLSDHRQAAFGEAYGILIKELRLLARSVFVVDADGDIRYVQVVKEMTNEPDYEPVLAAVQKLV